MRHVPIALVRVFLLAATLAAVQAGPAPAAEGPPVGATTLQRSDPCGFFRGQAYGKGITHFTTEMLWACEAIAERQAAAQPLGDRLEAAAVALERYRAAVIAAALDRFGRHRRAAGARLGLSSDAALALADSTGALAALEGIRTGF